MDAQKLFDALFKLEEGERILVCTFVEGRRQAILAESTEQAVRATELLVEREQNAYFGVAPRDSKGKVKEVTCLWADVDSKNFPDGKKGALAAASSFYAAPASFLIDSGHGFHCYWLLKSRLDSSQAKRVMMAIQRLQNGDFTYDPTRLLRVPGSVNYKDPETPVSCHILKERGHLTYDPSDLLSLTNIQRKVLHRLVTGSKRGFKSRSERDWNITTELLRVGISTETIQLLFSELPCGDKYREEGPSYLERTIMQARESLKRKQPDLAFSAAGDCFFRKAPDGTQRLVSTFTFEPTKLLHSLGSEGEDSLLGIFRASGKVWEGRALPKSAFGGTSAILKSLPVAYWQWLGSDKEVRLLLPYLMAQLKEKGTPSAIGTTFVGRVGEFWVAPGMTLSAENVFSVQDAPIAYLPTGREFPRVKYVFPDDETYKDLAAAIFELCSRINAASVIWPVLGWFAAAPLKPVLDQSGIRFPALNLFGSRGGGKTSTILRVMQPLFGYEEPRSYDCITTQFVILSLLASSNAVPISFSEFRRSMMSNRDYDRLMRYVLLAYDVGHDTRGRADQTTRDYPLSAPVTVDGEDAFADPAAKERSVIINFDPGVIEVGLPAWQAFEALTAMPLSDFAGRYVQRTLREDSESIRTLFDSSLGLIHRAVQRKLPDRVRRNLAVCLTGIRLLKDHLQSLDLDLPDITSEFISEIFEGSIEHTVLGITGRTSALVDEFVEDLINQIAMSDARKPFFYKIDMEKGILWMHLSTALNWWFQKRRSEGRPVLESAAMKTQLREREQSRRGGQGQYVLSRQAVNIGGTTKWCYGLDLAVCHECLDVPDTIREAIIALHLTSTKGG